MHALDVLGEPVRRRILEVIGAAEVSAGSVAASIARLANATISRWNGRGSRFLSCASAMSFASFASANPSVPVFSAFSRAVASSAAARAASASLPVSVFASAVK